MFLVNIKVTHITYNENKECTPIRHHTQCQQEYTAKITVPLKHFSQNNRVFLCLIRIVHVTDNLYASFFKSVPQLNQTFNDF